MDNPLVDNPLELTVAMTPRVKTPSFSAVDPTGKTMKIPASAEEDFPYFNPDQIDAIKRYYQEEGYVVVRKVFPAPICNSAMESFDAEIKPSNRYLYRQATAIPGRHIFNAEGHMMNTLLNIQSLPTRDFPSFCKIGLSIITDAKVQTILAALLEEAGKLIQSMYFHGNVATGAHQDTFYIDSEEPGRMVGVWFAMEDIAPGAGRFYIYPRSHVIGVPRDVGYRDLAFNRDRYQNRLIDMIREHRLECRVPALQQGDVLFWSSKLIHGSLKTSQPHRSRSSFTSHYIPDSSRLIQFRSRVRSLNLQTISGMRVHKPKDLDRASQRLIFWMETHLPRAFQMSKKLALKVLTS